MKNSLKELISGFLVIGGLFSAIAGFYGPMCYASNHPFTTPLHDWLVVFGGVAVMLVGLFLCLFMAFLSDRLWDPNAFRKWFPK